MGTSWLLTIPATTGTGGCAGAGCADRARANSRVSARPAPTTTTALRIVAMRFLLRIGPTSLSQFEARIIESVRGERCSKTAMEDYYGELKPPGESSVAPNGIPARLTGELERPPRPEPMETADGDGRAAEAVSPGYPSSVAPRGMSTGPTSLERACRGWPD